MGKERGNRTEKTGLAVEPSTTVTGGHRAGTSGYLGDFFFFSLDHGHLQTKNSLVLRAMNIWFLSFSTFFLYSTRASFMGLPFMETPVGVDGDALLLVHEGHSSFPSTCITVSARALGVHARYDQSRHP